MPSAPFIDKIPAMVQGISKQAPSVRFPGQVEDAENVFFNIVDGARKRRGSKILSALANADASLDYGMHRIERDDQEEYVIVHGKGFFAVVDVNSGKQYVLSTPGYLSNAHASEMRFVTIADSTFCVNTTRTPRCVTNTGEDIEVDNMPILMQRTVNTSGEITGFTFTTVPWKSRTRNRQVIKNQGNLGEFRLYYGEGPGTYIVPGDASSLQIQEAIQGNGVHFRDMFKEEKKHESFTNSSGTYSYSKIVSWSPERWQCIDPQIPQQKPDQTWPATPGSSDSPVHDLLSLMPANWFNYGKVIVSGGPMNRRDVIIQISPELETDSVFSTSRGHTVEVGDRDADMAPPFAYNPSNDPEDPAARDGLPIRDIGYIRNRLVIACDEFLCFSAIDDMFNFYQEEPPDLIDSDPITAQLAATDVCLVDFIIPFRKAILVLTSSGQQFELTGGDVLAPDTAAVSPSTKYETQKIKPVQIGDRLFMVGRSADYSTLMEYFYDDAAVSNTAAMLTKHVDNLLPKNMKSMAASPTQESVFLIPELGETIVGATVVSADTGAFLTGATWDNAGVIPDANDRVKIISDHVVHLDSAGGGDTWPPSGDGRNGDSSIARNTGIEGEMFVYRSFTAGNERKQSSWARWTVGRDRLMDCTVVDDTMIILRKQTMGGSGTHLILESLDLSEAPVWDEDTDFPTVVHIDHRLAFPLGTRHSVVDNGDGTHTSKYKITSSTDVGGSVGSGKTYPSTYTDTEINYVEFPDGTMYKSTSAQVTHEGDAFTFTHDDGVNPDTSKFYAGRAVSASLTLTEVFARDREKRPVTDGRTMLKKIVVEHRRAGTYDITTTHNNSDVGVRTDTFSPNSVITTETGLKTAWIHGESKDVTVKLTSPTPKPVTWTSIETHGTHSTQTE